MKIMNKDKELKKELHDLFREELFNDYQYELLERVAEWILYCGGTKPVARYSDNHLSVYADRSEDYRFL